MRSRSWKRESGAAYLAFRAMAIGIVAVLFLMFADTGVARAELLKLPDDAVAKTLDGKTIGLADHRGKLVFLVIWRTDCVACLAEIPILKKMQEEYAGDDFTVIGLSVDREKDDIVAKAIEVYGINYPVWLGFDQPLLRYTNSPILPTLFTVGPNGEVFGYLIGPFMSYEHAVAIFQQARAFIAKHKQAE